MRLALPVGIFLVTLTVAAAAVAAWVSVADAPWEGKQGNITLLCQDALDRRKAVEEALQRPVTLVSGAQVPLSSMRGSTGSLGDEVERLESDLRTINRDIQKLCE